MGIAWSYNSLVLGRIIVGGGIGLASLTTPMYIAEVASPSTRGTLVTVNGLLICFGQFSAGMIDGILDEIDPDNGWRIMLGLAAVPSIIMFIGFQYMPESPRWLVMKGRNQEAKTVLMSIRDTDSEANDELDEIIQVCLLMGATSGETSIGGSSIESPRSSRNIFDYGNADSDGGNGSSSSSSSGNDEGALELNLVAHENSPEPLNRHNREEDFDSSARNDTSFLGQVKEMMSDQPTRRALKLGCGMMVLQQLCGINTVMYYAASIYQMSGFDGESNCNLPRVLNIPFANSIF
jgi:MFS family permease